MNRPNLISSIAERASVEPAALALKSNSDSLTYRTLDLHSNRTARSLQLRGLTPGSLAAIVMERSTEFVVTALSIWKAGAAYVPIDPSYPAERIAFMLDDCGASVVVTTHGSQPHAPRFRDRLFLIDRESNAIATQSCDPACGNADEQTPAYVIYTSGSTGQPNGVEVTHSNLAHLVAWHHQAFGIRDTDRACFLSSPGFDAAVWEVWPYLAAGASVHLPDDIVRRSPELLRDWLIANQITIAFAPTPLAEAMLTIEWPRNSTLRTLLTGADTLHRFPTPGLPFDLVNNYGPTECTVVSTSGRVPPAGNAPGRPSIGKPVTGAEIRILDAGRCPVPEGSEGEIYIGGAGVARGYLGRPELTAGRFIGGFFKTSDLGRMLPNGEIEFLGRCDEQIKIRGYRVELGDIVSALDSHPAVEASTVTLDKNGPDPRLVAYLALRAGSVLGFTELVEFLKPKLPAHMLPACFVIIDRLPTTAHGKVDRARLPEPSVANTLRNAGPAIVASPVQKQVTETLGGLLRQSTVALDDNFFMLGGHSLLGTQLIVRLRAVFGVDLDLLTLFNNPTARSLASEIERQLVLAGS